MTEKPVDQTRDNEIERTFERLGLATDTDRASYDFPAPSRVETQQQFIVLKLSNSTQPSA